MTARERAMLKTLRECETFVLDYIRCFGYGFGGFHRQLLVRIRAHTKGRTRG